MSDNGEADTEEPAVPLGEGDPVEGAPTARITSRLYFPIEESEVLRREGDTTIRTPDGPRDLADVLAESDEVYFPDRQSLVDTVEGVIGTGPIPTDGDGSSGEAASSEDLGTEVAEADNAAEASQGTAAPDEDNAAEADEETGEADVDEDEGTDAAAPPADESIEDEGGFEFNDPEE